MKKIIILGAGESGVGSAILAKKNSYDVFVSDYGAIEMPVKKQFNELNIRFEENSHELAKSKDIDFVVKSPGISDTTDIIKFYLDKGIRIISEIEFAYNFSKSPIIGIKSKFQKRMGAQSQRIARLNKTRMKPTRRSTAKRRRMK